MLCYFPEGACLSHLGRNKQETEQRQENYNIYYLKKMRMKIRNLFALTLTTMAFAACSNDDAPANGGDQKVKSLMLST